MPAAGGEAGMSVVAGRDPLDRSAMIVPQMVSDAIVQCPTGIDSLPVLDSVVLKPDGP